MAELNDRPGREPLFFAAACALVALAFQGTRGLYETDEGRYAECAREMLATGDFLVPRLQGILHLTKPPGTYWLVAAGIELLGRNAWGARLFLGIAFALSAWAVRTIARAFLGDAGGARAGWCYLLMLYPFLAGSILTPDTFLAAGVLGSLACLVTSRRARLPAAWLGGAALCLAAGGLAKGHLALLPWVVVVGALALLPHPPRTAWWVGVAIAGALGSLLGWWWFWWARQNVPGAAEHFEEEISRRLTGTGDHSARSLWYYPGLLIAGAAPWWLQVVRGVRRLTPYRPPDDTDPRPAERASDAVLRRLRLSPTGAAVLLWAGLLFLVFEVVPAKMPLYVLPIAAPIALWAAAGARDPDSPWPVRPAFVAAWLAVLLGIRGGAALHESQNDMRALAALVETADRGRGLPVLLLAGADAQGLDFYRDGRVVRVGSAEVETDRSTLAFGDEARERAARGERWLLVTEVDEACDRSVARVLGDAARETARRGDWRILEVQGVRQR